MNIDKMRDDDGTLPAFAWPGGYPIFYFSKCGMICCPECANREIDRAQETVAGDINWEDDSLFCDDCNAKIESAYDDDNGN